MWWTNLADTLMLMSTKFHLYIRTRTSTRCMSCRLFHATKQKMTVTYRVRSCLKKTSVRSAPNEL